MRYFVTLLALCSLAFGASAAQPKVVAHRGYWTTQGSAQNSIRSLVKADSIGCYASEFDVWFTADDSLVVNHDSTFRGVKIADATWPEVRAIRLDNGETLPSLAEYLDCAAALPGTRLVLELKSLPDLMREDEAARRIVREVERRGLWPRTDVIAFSINACLAFKKLAPEGTRIYYLDGDLAPAKIKALGLAGIDYSNGTMRKHPEWISQARDLGLEVNVWTIDKPEDMRYYLEQGVDYITTNQPELLQQLLAE